MSAGRKHSKNDFGPGRYKGMTHAYSSQTHIWWDFSCCTKHTHHTKRVQGDGKESYTTRSAEMLSLAAISNKYNLTVIQINILKLHILSRMIYVVESFWIACALWGMCWMLQCCLCFCSQWEHNLYRKMYLLFLVFLCVYFSWLGLHNSELHACIGRDCFVSVFYWEGVALG